MTKRPEKGRALFYHRDSAAASELAPPQYVTWAQAESAKLGLTFAGTPDAIVSMIARGVSAEGDLFIDYGISGNQLTRPGFDAFRTRASSDTAVSHLLVSKRDRFARPDNSLDAMLIEYELRSAGLTIVLMGGKILPPIPRGQRIDLADLLTSMIDYDASGKFRRDLSEKLIHAKIKLAGAGFSIGGEPVYGFRRWLCAQDGTRKRELEDREVVKKPGHHVIWLPTATAELTVVTRILDLIETTPAARIARLLNAEGIPSPKAGRVRTRNGVKIENSGLWTQNTVRNIATHALLAAVWEYGKRSEGDQLRFTAHGPRPLGDGDYRADGKPKTVANPADLMISTVAKSDPVIAPKRFAKIRSVVERRGRHLKGKARTRGETPNPLGGRVYDLTCGWPMYRYARRGRWCYTCALYQNSEAQCCNHNVVEGATATRFVLSCLRQRVLAPNVLAKLKARLRQLATAEQGEDPTARQLESVKTELAAVQRKLTTVSRNMALAETPEERSATAAVFRDLKAEEARLERRIGEPHPTSLIADPDREVEAALGVLDCLIEFAGTPGTDYAAVGETFRRTNARLYLKFRKVERGRRKFNIPAGGVLTFGSSPPPAALYEGPTDRAIIRKMLATGESVSAVSEHGAPRVSDAGQDIVRSANVQRGTTRCSRPRPR
jgi:DNA invertase Pin-like site-specific DNA recombinase